MDDLESELCLYETGHLGLRFAPDCPQIPPARCHGAESDLVWQVFGLCAVGGGGTEALLWSSVIAHHQSPVL